ncbi:MAG: AraC family transcriptional regulator, partial [Bacteroidetes bacterium]|nr:AraC family transcriptional regulator [Bacteroidota bacterium]
MKKEKSSPHKFESLSEAHQAFGLPKPLHPLISLVNNSNTEPGRSNPPKSHVLSFYKISYKPGLSKKLKYGQDYYDFSEGGLL